MDIRAGLMKHRVRKFVTRRKPGRPQAVDRSVSGGETALRRSALALLIFMLPPAASVRAEPATGIVRGKVTVMKKALFGGTKKSDDASGVIVYVTGYTETAPAQVAVLDQENKEFNPRLLPIVAGQTVSFPNQDRFYHNVFSVAQAQAFDLGQYKSSETPRTQRFDKPGLIPVYCNIHPQMISYLVVLENRAFAVTGPDGSFELHGVHAGPVAVNAWAPGAQRATQQMELAPGAEASVTLEIARTQAILPHLRKDGTAYPSQTDDDDDY